MYNQKIKLSQNLTDKHDILDLFKMAKIAQRLRKLFKKQNTDSEIVTCKVNHQTKILNIPSQTSEKFEGRCLLSFVFCS